MRGRCALVTLLLVASSGCIIIPVPHPERPISGSRQVPGETVATVMSRPAASRGDVLCALGEPDWSWDNDRVFVYRSSTSDLSILWAGAGGNNADAGVWDPAKHRFVFVEFDSAGKVLRWEERGLPFGSTVEDYQKRFWRAW